jgi:hypothetical protein
MPTENSIFNEAFRDYIKSQIPFGNEVRWEVINGVVTATHLNGRLLRGSSDELRRSWGGSVSGQELQRMRRSGQFIIQVAIQHGQDAVSADYAAGIRPQDSIVVPINPDYADDPELAAILDEVVEFPPAPPPEVDIVELTAAEAEQMENPVSESDDDLDSRQDWVEEVFQADSDGTGLPYREVLTNPQIEIADRLAAEERGEEYVPPRDALRMGEGGTIANGFAIEQIERIVPTYYRLGYVLESIARNFKQPDGKEIIDLNFIYHKLPNAPVAIPLLDGVKDAQHLPEAMLPPGSSGGTGERIAEDGRAWNEYLRNVTDIARSGQEFLQSELINHQKMWTTFDAPIPVQSTNALLNNNPKMNALKLIKRIIDLASNVLNPAKESVGFRLDSRVNAGNTNVIEIFCASNIEQDIEDQIETLLKNGEVEKTHDLAIAITYAQNNSLVESIDVSSKIDPNSWAVFRQEGATNRMGIDLTNELTNNDGLFTTGTLPAYIRAIINKITWTQDRYLQPGEIAKQTLTNQHWNELVADTTLQLHTKTQGELELIKDIALTLSQFEKFKGQDVEGYGDTERLSNSSLGTLLFTDPLFYNSLLVKFMENNQNVHLGKVLSNYLLTVTATIHGVVGLSPLDYVLVDNVIEGVRGIYYISNLEEDLRPGGFNTLVTMQLARQL